MWALAGRWLSENMVPAGVVPQVYQYDASPLHRRVGLEADTDCDAPVASPSGRTQGSPGNIGAMNQARLDRDSATDRARNGFAVARAQVIKQLAQAGLPPVAGETLVDEWLRSTQMLADFRAAPDYWSVAYRFAMDEYRRRAPGQLTRPMVPGHR